MARKRDQKVAVDPTPAKPKTPGKGAWKLMDRGATIAGGLLAQRAAQVAWRGLTGKRPPSQSRHPEVRAREAVLWAVVGGGVTELVKTGVRRGMATYWVRSTGELPPGMKPLLDQPGPRQDDDTSAAEAAEVKRTVRKKR